MKDPFILATNELTKLKNLVQLISGSGNNRRLMPLSGREILGYDECPRFDLETPLLKVDTNANLVKARVKKHWYAIVYPGTKTMFDDQDGKFQAKQNKYFIKNESGWGEFISKNRQKPTFLDESDYYHVQSLSENDMQTQAKTTPGLGQIRQDLRFQLGEWLVNNRDKIMQRTMNKIDEKYGRDSIDGTKATANDL